MTKTQGAHVAWILVVAAMSTTMFLLGRQTASTPEPIVKEVKVPYPVTVPVEVPGKDVVVIKYVPRETSVESEPTARPTDCLAMRWRGGVVR